MAVSTSVRPPRIAVLCDIADPHWSYSCKHILELFCSLWGGHGCIIVPTDGKKIEPIFWKLLQLFDPDYLCEYRVTFRDLDDRDPVAFAQTAAQKIREWTSDGIDLSVADKTRVAEALRNKDMSEIPISTELRRELKHRLTSFFLNPYVVQADAWRSGRTFKFPYTNTCDILEQAEVTQQFVVPVVNQSSSESLWFSANLGTFNRETLEGLSKLNLTPYSYGDGSSTGNSVEEQRRLVSFAIDRCSGEGRSSLQISATDSSVSWPISLTAADLSLKNLGWYRQLRSNISAPKAIAVAGNNLRDFCFYLALSRMRERVFWVYPEIADDAKNGGGTAFGGGPSYAFSNALRIRTEFVSQYSPGLDVVSATLTNQELGAISDSLTAAGQCAVHLSVLDDPLAALPDLPLRYLESASASKQKTVHLPESGIIELFETPKPLALKTVDPSRHRWITDLEIRGYKPARNSDLSTWLIGGATRSTTEVRTSAIGYSYFCPNSMIFFGQDVDSALVRPDIRVPPARDIFDRLAHNSSITCEISDKGFYSQEAIEKLGGLEQAAQFLKSRPGLALAAAFQNKEPIQEGRHDNGVLLEDRRYLNSAALVKVMGTVGYTAQSIDRLSKAGILYKGFVLQCEFCRYAAWFPISDLTDRFTCRRCHRSQVYTSKHWKTPRIQPAVYYQLDEIVYQGLVNNMVVPILTLDYLRRNSADSFQYTEELEYRTPDSRRPFIECDVNCVVDGAITIGEAKTADRLDASRKKELQIIDKYLQLASSLGARRLVFSTRADEWDLKTSQTIGNAFAKTGVELLFLSNSQLFA